MKTEIMHVSKQNFVCKHECHVNILRLILVAGHNLCAKESILRHQPIQLKPISYNYRRKTENCISYSLIIFTVEVSVVEV